MGFWVPSDPTAAKKLDAKQCRNIFGSLVSETLAAAKDWQNPHGATLNLKVNPAGQEDQIELPNGKGTGELLICVLLWFVNGFADVVCRRGGQLAVSELCFGGAGECESKHREFRQFGVQFRTGILFLAT